MLKSSQIANFAPKPKKRFHALSPHPEHSFEIQSHVCIAYHILQLSVPSNVAYVLENKKTRFLSF